MATTTRAVIEDASTDTLLAVRDHLLAGLDVVAERLADGTFNVVGPKGSAPPSQSGQLTLALFYGVETELALRAAATRILAEERKQPADRWYNQPPYATEED